MGRGWAANHGPLPQGESSGVLVENKEEGPAGTGLDGLEETAPHWSHLGR